MTKPAEFFRHGVTMMTGTAFAQAIPILIAPVLTRFYAPTEFGIFSAVVAAAAILSVIATLRFEIAIVLPSADAVAADLTAVAICCSLLICGGFALVIIAVAPNSVVQLLGRAGEFAILVPALALLMAWNQIANFLANRERGYRAIAGGAITQQATAATIATGLGAVAFPWNGLLIGRFTGLVVGTSAILFALRGWLRRNLRFSSLQQLQSVARQYRQFPLFNVPYSLMGTLSREFMILAFTAAHQLGAAGYYGLARSVLTAPISFLSSSLSQVFYREAAENIGTPGFTRLTLILLHSIAAFTPFFALGAFWAPDVFAFVFGPQWREAGQYASTLMPMALLALFTSWPERVYEVRQKQHVSLIIQVCFDMIAIASVWTVLHFGAPPLTAIRVYVGVEVVYHLVYLYAVFQFSEIGAIRYLRLIGTIALAFAASALLQMGVFQTPTSVPVQFVVSVAISTILAGILLFLTRLIARKPAMANCK